ncbi:DUF937 domain-containing protein [Capnocytophaga canis]|nr:DUF937 domain-containing protein [Capnocytophaga canis]
MINKLNMAGILDFLGENNFQQIVNGVSKETGVSPSKASSVIEMATPLLLGAMQNKSDNEQAATGLLSALTSDKHNGNLLNNLGSLFENKGDNPLTNEGSGILGHLLGGKESTLSDAISSKTGVSSSNVLQILKILAPVLMSFIAKKMSENNVSSASGLGGLLSTLTGNSSGGNLLTSLLDANGDGNILDDVVGKLGNSSTSSKNGGLGDVLGGFFGGK